MSPRHPLPSAAREAAEHESHGLAAKRPATSSSLAREPIAVATVATSEGLGGARSRVLPVETLSTLLAVLSAAAATVHFSVIPSHFREHWLFGTFFVLAAAFQAGWALLAARHGSALLYRLGAAGNAALAATWVVSRTTGLPFGPHAGEPEPLGFGDVLVTVYEVLIVAGALAMIHLAPFSSAAGFRVRLRRVWPVAAVVFSLTAASVAGLGVPLQDTHEAAAGHAAETGHHLLHLFLVGAAGLVFAAYVATAIWQRGWAGFSWSLKEVEDAGG